MASPKLPRERVLAVLECLAAGMNAPQASAAAGVSAMSAYRILASIGGVCRPAGTAYSDRYLNLDKRLELARLRECGLSLRAIGERIGVAASTVSRELARNASPRTGRYQPHRADRLAWDRQRRPKPGKLAVNPALAGQVRAMLASSRLTVEAATPTRAPIARTDSPASRSRASSSRFSRFRYRSL